MKNTRWLGLGVGLFSVACGTALLTSCSKFEAPTASLSAALISSATQTPSARAEPRVVPVAVAASVELQHACSRLADESQAVVRSALGAAALQRVLPAEAAKLPHFGLCQPAGLGSFALVLKELSGSAQPAALHGWG